MSKEEIKLKTLSNVKDKWPYQVHYTNGLDGYGAYLFWSTDKPPEEPINWNALFEMHRLYKESSETVIPRFSLGEDTEWYRWWNKDAEKMAADLSLKEDGTLDFKGLNKARILRDEYRTFLDAIHDDIDEIDSDIIDVLKVWYYKTIENVKELSDKDKRAEALDGVAFNLRCFFRDWIRRGVSIEKLPGAIENQLNHLPYTPETIKDSTFNGIIYFEQKKWDKYKKMAKLLTKFMLYWRAVQLYLKDEPIHKIKDEDGNIIVPDLTQIWLKDSLSAVVENRIKVFAEQGREENEKVCITLLTTYERGIDILRPIKKKSVILDYIRKTGELNEFDSLPTPKTLKGWIESYRTAFYSNPMQ